MIGKSCSFNKEALREFFQQRIDYVSLTTDFWTGRAKKRNIKFMNVFAPSWDSNEDIESE